LIPSPKLLAPIPAKKPYKPVLSVIERRAYAAAHRLLQLSASGERELACPGARRAAMVDRIASVLIEEFSECKKEKSLVK
jgi:hypothetical protein